MTPIEGATDELGRLRELERAATPGPWTSFGGWDAFRSIATTADYHSQWSVGLPDDGSVPGFMLEPEADAALIAAARNALPLLLDVAEAARCVMDVADYYVDAETESLPLWDDIPAELTEADGPLPRLRSALAALQASQGASDDPTA